MCIRNILVITVFAFLVLSLIYTHNLNRVVIHNVPSDAVHNALPRLTYNERIWLNKLEKTLCQRLVKSTYIPAGQRGPCPRGGIVTVSQGGRLGNQMWEYASVWGLARSTGLEPFIPRCLLQTLEEIFQPLSIPSLASVAHCALLTGEVVGGINKWKNRNQSISLPRSIIEYNYVLNHSLDIRKEFIFKDNLRAQAQRRLRNAISSANNQENVVFVGVHVRRTDYHNLLNDLHNETYAGVAFYRKAMAYFEDKFDNAMFIVVSDDPGWCRSNLAEGKSNVLVMTEAKSSPSEDLALMAACNHSIIDYGTYGAWGAILAGGETVAYKGWISRLFVKFLHPLWQLMTDDRVD